jgi:HPt (histidine-containing phosphotransfer) domain-containing protein
MEHIPKCYNTDNLMSKTNPLFVEKMVGMFIKLSKEYLININRALDNSDLSQINQLAHYIKPSVDLLCIYSIKQSVREIEQATEISSDLADTIDFTNHQLQLVIDQMHLDSK